MFDENKDYGGGGYLRKEGDFFLKILSWEYDDAYFPKYKVDAEVVSGPNEGEFVQGTITKPTEKYMNDNDRALGGFSFAQVGAYVVGAGVTAEVNALENKTVGAIGKIIVNKIIKARVQLTRKSQQAKEDGQTTGLYYEIGRIYKHSDWINEEVSSYETADPVPPPDIDYSHDMVSPFDLGNDDTAGGECPF